MVWLSGLPRREQSDPKTGFLGTRDGRKMLVKKGRKMRFVFVLQSAAGLSMSKAGGGPD